MIVYPHHRITIPTEDDYANQTCANCSGKEVIWFDKSANEVECYECGSIYFI